LQVVSAKLIDHHDNNKLWLGLISLSFELWRVLEKGKDQEKDGGRRKKTAHGLMLTLQSRGEVGPKLFWYRRFQSGTLLE
jgi:hypothetical protein